MNCANTLLFALCVRVPIRARLRGDAATLDTCPRDRFLFPRFADPANIPNEETLQKLLLPVRVAVGGRRNGDRVPPPLADHDQVGMSTGVFASSRGSWPRLVDQATRVSTIAVALSALSGDELPGLAAYLCSEPRLPFGYVSVHAPVKGIDLNRGYSLLLELPSRVRSIVVHPDAEIDLDSCRALGSRLTLENMGFRKDTGRVVSELEPFFAALPDAGFCLDIAHTHSIDLSMNAAHELLDRFRGRLRQVHLSSLCDGHHVPVTEGDESLFARVLDRCRDVPWILEAPPPDRWTERLGGTAVAAGAASVRDGR